MGKTAKTVTEDGVEIVYELDGTGAPLLLIHGTMENRTIWEPVMPLLLQDYQVIRLDLRGHGESGPATTYDMHALASDVAAVARDLGLAIPHLVGHSLGGAVATVVAGTMGAHSVVNVDQPFQDPNLFAELLPLEERLRGPQYAQALFELMAGLSDGALTSAQLAKVRQLCDSGRQEVLLALWAPFFQGQLPALLAMFEAFLPTITTPYLSLHGRTPPLGYQSWLQGLMPQAHFAVMTGTGHYPFLVDPVGFVKQIKDFHLSL